jgi:hypothetical protein
MQSLRVSHVSQVDPYFPVDRAATLCGFNDWFERWFAVRNAPTIYWANAGTLGRADGSVVRIAKN